MTNGENFRKALFLDQDGVINVEKNYVYRFEDFEFIDGIFGLRAYAQSLDFKLIVITNQAGIAQGYCSEADYQHLTDWMVQQFRDRGNEGSITAPITPPQASVNTGGIPSIASRIRA